MKQLAVINAIIILILNYLTIKSVIQGFDDFNFAGIALYVGFLVILDTLAVLIYLKESKVWSKYLYPAELILYLSLIAFKFIATENAFDELNAETIKSNLKPIEVCENSEIGIVEKYINIKIPKQNIFMDAKITTYFKGNFENLALNKNIFNASKQGFTKFDVSFPFLFLHDCYLAISIDVTYDKIDATLLDVSISKKENEKIFKVKYMLTYSYSSHIDYLETKYGANGIGDVQIEEKEITYKFVKKEDK